MREGTCEGDDRVFVRLIERMPYLRELDRLRTRARQLRKANLKSILAEQWTEEPAVSPTPSTRVLFRRAKQLAWSLGDYSHCDADPPHFPDWPTLTLGPPAKPSGSDPDDAAKGTCAPVDVLDSTGGTVPIFFSAQFLRARMGNLKEGHITSDCALAYYRLIRELYTLVPDKNPIGRASADGDRGHSSAFVTGECARAIHQVETGIRATANFLGQVRALAGEWESIFGAVPRVALPPGLSTQIRTRLSVSLRSAILNASDGTFLQLEPPGSEAAFETMAELVQAAVRHFVIESYSELTSVKNWVHELEVDTKFPFSVQGHEVAKAAISEAQAVFGKLRTVVEAATRETKEDMQLSATQKEGVIPQALPNGAPLFRGLEKISETAEAFTQQLSARVKRHLLLINAAQESAMYRALFLIENANEQTALEELVFASETFGSTTNSWEHPAVIRTLDLIQENLDYCGRLPRGEPFSERLDDGQRTVESAHVIRAIAHLMQHAPGDINSVVVGKLVRYFETNFEPTPTSLSVRTHKKVAPWQSAIAILALDRIVQMLSSRLNAAIKEHFSVQTAAAIAQSGVPSIDKLLWSDVGTTHVLRHGDLTKPSIHEVLYGMRSGLVRQTEITRQLTSHRSLLLYGPPGTGKSTLMQALAGTAQVDLVTVSPDSFLFEGLASLEQQLVAIMDALAMLTGTVILFDEFESMIEARSTSGAGKRPRTQFDFLTTNLLPKLSRLYDRGPENRTVYAAATNFVEVMDEAAIREKRFDEKLFLFYPDPVARLIGLLKTYSTWRASSGKGTLPAHQDRCSQLACRARLLSAAKLANAGWFGGKTWQTTQVGRVVLGDGLDLPKWGLPPSGHVDDGMKNTRPNTDNLSRERALQTRAAMALEKIASQQENTTIQSTLSAFEKHQGVHAHLQKLKVQFVAEDEAVEKEIFSS